MPNVPESVRAEIIAYSNLLRSKLCDQPFEVRLFGSYARGRAFAGSDVDVAVLSDGFQRLPWGARMKLLQTEGARFQKIAPVGITFSELQFNRYPTIIRTIRGPNSMAACKSV
jgi:predicted nucleotidyltransferase